VSDASLVIAIDGPAASGKSTVSRDVARRLGALYLDSGSLYRGVTWKAVREDVEVGDPASVVRLMDAMDWQFAVRDGRVVYEIDGEDPGAQIRSEPVVERVSAVAAIPAVRERINRRLRDARRFGPLVVEGRDIGSIVFPHANYKFYLDASPDERARRRRNDAADSAAGRAVEAVRDDLERRDRMDRSRSTAPLQIPLGAVVIDTTDLALDTVVERVIEIVQGRPTE
jgi:cytidylate kinase